MTNDAKSFVWGVILTLMVFGGIHACSDDKTTTQQQAPVESVDGRQNLNPPAPDGCGSGTSSDPLYMQPPNLTIPSIDIPSAPPAAPSVDSTPAQAAPAPAIAAPN